MGGGYNVCCVWGSVPVYIAIKLYTVFWKYFAA